MNRSHLTLVQRVEPRSEPITFAEKLSDHQALLRGYLDTYTTRNYSDRTSQFAQRFLTGWFAGFTVPDDGVPEGERQLLVWEAMTPVTGRQHIVDFSKGLIAAGLKTRTVQTYLGSLRRLFQYVQEYPYIPGTPVQSIVEKYGRIEQPVLEYDYPAHALDQDDEGFVLTGQQLIAFYDFVYGTYVTRNQKKYPAWRNYTMIVIAGESGLRADEICHLDALPPHRDLFYEEHCLQTRSGKGVNGSGKRVRKTICTPFAEATLRAYERQIRPMFPHASTNPALFLTESGERMTYKAAWRNLAVISKEAREAHLEIPVKMGWHSLRKSFATNFLEEHPDRVWLLMDMMGHFTLGTLHRYVKHKRSYYTDALQNIMEELVPPVKPGPHHNEGEHLWH